MTRRSAKRRWKQWSETEARAALDAWQASGTSAQQFAHQRGFSPTRLTYWRRRLARDTAPAFVQVVAPARGDACIEIERAGVVLRVREGFDPERLARLVAALAAVEAPC